MTDTDIFDEAMKLYFHAKEGAYTRFTATEITKSTYNVKSVIKQLLYKNPGKDKIPHAGDGTEQSITFEVCPKGKIYNKATIEIPCKFSKPNKEEISIYFKKEQTSDFQEGDYWYLYLTEESSFPVIGIMSDSKWTDLFSDASQENDEPDETLEDEIKYCVPTENLRVTEVDPPDMSEVIRSEAEHTVKSLTPEQSKIRAGNMKIKGNKGEDIVLEIERRKMMALNRPDLIPKITHVAKYKDGLGYDVISLDIDENGNYHEIFIEVKTTAGSINTPFYVSSNELLVSQKLRLSYYLYRIFDLSQTGDSVGYYKIRGALDESCNLSPVDYIASPKK